MPPASRRVFAGIGDVLLRVRPASCMPPAHEVSGEVVAIVNAGGTVLAVMGDRS